MPLLLLLLFLHGRSSLFLACHTSSWCTESFIFIPKPMQLNICVNCTSTVAFSSFALSIQRIVYGFIYSYSHLFSYTIYDPLHHRVSFIWHIVQSAKMCTFILCDDVDSWHEHRLQFHFEYSNAQNNAKKIYNKLMKLMPEWNMYGCETSNSDAHC